MKINPKVDLSRGDKISGEKTPTGNSSAKIRKSKKAVYTKDKAALVREKEEKSSRKLGIIGQAEKLQNQAPNSHLAQKKNWTVLCYFAGDCGLEPDMVRSLIDLEKIGSGKDMNLAAQIDRGKNPTLKLGGKAGAARYYLQKSADPEKITSRESAALGQVNSAHPKTLEDFLKWGMKNYPAEHYLIIAEGHGSGAFGLLTDEGPEAKKHDEMTIPEFAGAVRKAEKASGVSPDQVLLGLKSCEMGQAEAAYEFKDIAARLIVSQKTIQASSWRMDELFGQPGTAAKDLDQMAFHLHRTNLEAGEKKPPIASSTLLDLKAAPRLKKSLRRFIAAAKATKLKPEALKAILEVESRSLDPETDGTLAMFRVSDLDSIAQKILKRPEIKDAGLVKAALDLRNSLKKVVLDAKTRDKADTARNYHGLGIVTDGNEKFHKKFGYSELALSQDTGWDEFLLEYAKGVKRETVESQLTESRPLKMPELKTLAALAQKAEGKLLSTRDKEEIREQVCDLHFEIDEMKDAAGDEQTKKCLAGLAKLLSETYYQADERLIPDYQAILQALSAQKGEISSQNLSRAARKLLETADSPAYRRLKAGKQFEETGQKMLHWLGVISRNQKLMNIENYLGATPHQALKQIARMDEEKEKNHDR